jgi:hypothetical protein
MPRKPKAQTEDEAIGGFPEHGDPAPDDAPPPRPEPDEEPEDEPEPEGEPETEVAQLKAQLAAIQEKHDREIAELRRATPPVERKEKKDEPPETDWDNLLFTKPKDAVAQIKKEAKEEVQREMRAEYQKDQGTRKFWADFYTSNPDLKQDDDLVQLVLAGSMSELANIPVTQAIKKLGDLTRERILRYAGGKPRGGRKAMSEGNSPPRARTPARETAEVTSLSDIIRVRRDRRHRKASAA